MNPIVNMSMADYLGHKAYGASDLVKMSRSFAYWKWRKEDPESKGRPLVVGNATHTLLQAALTGEKSLRSSILVYEDGSSLTKGFKVFQSEHPNHYCIDAEESALCERMVLALLNEPEVMGYLKDAIPEATVFGKYPGTEVQCKVRPDYLHLKRGVSINIKTTADASESGFIYAARDYGYEWQSALYCSILSEQFGRPFDEVHILVEKTEDNEPIPIEIYSFGDDTIGFARSQLYELIQQIPECEKTGIWPRKKAFLKTIEQPLHMRRFFSP